MDLVSAIGGQAGTAGWSKLGAALGGLQSGASQEAAYLKGQTQGVSLQSKLLDAKKKRDEALALEDQERILAEQTGDPKLAAIIANASKAGNNFQQSTAGYGNLQQQGFKDQAMTAATGETPDMNLVNRIMTVVSGRPAAQSKIEGNTLINPYATPDQQELETTPFGQEQLMRTERARGYATDTQAATARGRASYGVAGGRGGKSTDPDKARDTAIKAIAKDAYYAARADDSLPEGTTQADIEYQLRTKGHWTDPDGQVRARANVDGQELMQDDAATVSYEDAPSLVNAIGTGAPKSDGQAAARDQARREGEAPPVQVLGAGQDALVDQANGKLEEARAAIARGADPEQVRARLRKLGYPYIASKL